MRTTSTSIVTTLADLPWAQEQYRRRMAELLNTSIGNINAECRTSDPPELARDDAALDARASEFFGLNVTKVNSITSALCVVDASPPPQSPYAPPIPPGLPPRPPLAPPKSPGALPTITFGGTGTGGGGGGSGGGVGGGGGGGGGVGGGDVCTYSTTCTEPGCSLEGGLCVPCPAGTCCNGGIRFNCTANTYNNQRGRSCSECSPCPAQTVSKPGSTQVSDCVCDTGYFLPSPSEACDRCPLGAECQIGRAHV